MMKHGSMIVATSLIFALSASGGAQSTRWNDRVAPDTLGDAPGVRVWLEGSRSYAYGAPVRVRFAVDHDAYVIVGRVDGTGHLTVLYPNNRSVSRIVRANSEVLVRSRSAGSFATFYATDRMGSGYVFAMASYDPFDLSRLSLRDFDRYVTGSYVGNPSRLYVGDPYRVISRFASMVLFDDTTPFDYAVDYYNVDEARYQGSTGYASLCDGYDGYGRGYAGMQGRWVDDLDYRSSSVGGVGCGGVPCYIGGVVSYSYFGFGYPSCGYRQNNPQVVHGPPVPGGTPRDSVRGPLVDSIGHSRPDTVGYRPSPEGRVPPKPRLANDANGGVVVGGVRRAPLSSDDGEGGRVFSIPDRALTNVRRRNAEAVAPVGGVPDRSGLRNPATNGDPGVTWVRPPQEMTRGGGNATNEGAIPRPGRREGRGDESWTGGSRNIPVDRPMPPRRDEGVRFSEPTRNDGGSRANPTRFDPPPPSIHNSPQMRPDAPRSEPVRHEAPRAQVERPAPPPPAPAAKSPPPDKKP